MSNLTASVVITNHNYERFVARCVESALAQTVQAEVVVVDDASTDGSLEILHGFGDRIRLIETPGVGQGEAINRGVAAATGDVVVMSDADDVLLPTRVQEILEALEEEPFAAWVRHDLQIADEWGQVVMERFGYPAGRDPQHDVLTRGRTHGATSVLAFRRDALQALGPIPSPLRGYADVYLMAVAALVYDGRSLPRVLTKRHEHGSHHFTGHHLLEVDRAPFHVELRYWTARGCADVARVFGRFPEVAAMDTWWQRRAVLDFERLNGARLTRTIRLLAGLVAAVWVSSLSLARRLLLIGRASVLSLVPRSLFPAAWWLLNEGRAGFGRMAALRAELRQPGDD